MSLLRVTSKACPRAATTARTSVASRRHASDHGHDAHHDSHIVDTTVYPKEDFSSRMWLYGGLVAAGAVAFYNYAPTPDKAAGPTQFIAGLRDEAEKFKEFNAKHLELAYKNIEERRTVETAKMPDTHRYRYPQSFEVISPHCAPVGPTVDLSNVVVKRD